MDQNDMKHTIFHMHLTNRTIMDHAFLPLFRKNILQTLLYIYIYTITTRLNRPINHEERDYKHKICANCLYIFKKTTAEKRQSFKYTSTVSMWE